MHLSWEAVFLIGYRKSTFGALQFLIHNVLHTSLKNTGSKESSLLLISMRQDSNQCNFVPPLEQGWLKVVLGVAS